MIRLQVKSICIYLKIAKIKEIEAGASIKFIIFEHVQYRFNEHIHTYTYIYIYTFQSLFLERNHKNRIGKNLFYLSMKKFRIVS